MNDQCPLSDEQLVTIALDRDGISPNWLLFARAVATAAVEAEWKGRQIEAESSLAYGEYPEDADLPTRLRWHVPPSARYGSLCIEDDLREAADEIERLLAIPEDRAALGAECKRLAAETLRASKLADVIERLLARLKTLGCDDKPWAKQCTTCDLMIEARELLSAATSPQPTPQAPTPKSEWPEDADYALGHLAGTAFGLIPADEIGHCIGLIRDALAQQAAPAVQAWIPVSERLPEPSGDVLTVDRSGQIRVSWAGLLPTFSTHWMPLPPAPPRTHPSPAGEEGMSTEDKIAEMMKAVDNLTDAAIDNRPKWNDLRVNVESLARELAGPEGGWTEIASSEFVCPGEVLGIATTTATYGWEPPITQEDLRRLVGEVLEHVKPMIDTETLDALITKALGRTS